MVQPNKETIFTFDGNASFFIVLMFFPLFLNFFPWLDRRWNLQRCRRNADKWRMWGGWHTPPPRDVSTLVHNIPLMQWQTTGIGWSRLMLLCHQLMLHCHSYSLPIHTCSRHHCYMFVPTFTKCLEYIIRERKCYAWFTFLLRQHETRTRMKDTFVLLVPFLTYFCLVSKLSERCR